MGAVLLTPLAQDDLIDIWVFIAQENPAAADRLMDTIDERCRMLADSPELGSFARNLSVSEILSGWKLYYLLPVVSGRHRSDPCCERLSGY